MNTLVSVKLNLKVCELNDWLIFTPSYVSIERLYVLCLFEVYFAYYLVIF